MLLFDLMKKSYGDVYRPPKVRFFGLTFGGHITLYSFLFYRILRSRAKGEKSMFIIEGNSTSGSYKGEVSLQLYFACLRRKAVLGENLFIRGKWQRKKGRF